MAELLLIFMIGTVVWVAVRFSVPKPSGWVTHHFCKKCDGKVSNYARMYSGGRCPLCGHRGENACAIIDTYEKAARWTGGEWEYKEEEATS